MTSQLQSILLNHVSRLELRLTPAREFYHAASSVNINLIPARMCTGLLENGAHQAQHPQNQQQNPIQFYQAEMNSMLPPANMKVNGLGMQPYQGVGQISREHQLQSQQAPISKSLPR